MNNRLTKLRTIANTTILVGILTAAALGQTSPLYVITGSGNSFSATKNGAAIGAPNQSIQNVINAIKTDANGANCGIQFGETGAAEPLNIEAAYINFNGGTNGTDWGKITLSGKITSTNSISTQGTISLTNGVSVNSTADIGNTLVTNQNGRAIYSNTAGTLTISGGTVSAIAGRTIHNNSTGTVDISGGTVSATTGIAVYNNSSNGKITVSDNATITSANVTAASGTIVLNNGTVEITGGTVENTAANGNAVYCNNAGAKVELGGNPDILGRIRVYSAKLSVITDQNDASKFNPANGKIYTILLQRYSAGDTVAVGAKPFLSNFAITNNDYKPISYGNDIVLASSTAGFFMVASNGGNNFTLTNSQPTDTDGFPTIMDAVNHIKTAANGANCHIQFAESDNDTLKLGSASLLLDGSGGPGWGTITLSGKITTSNNYNSNNRAGALVLDNNVSINIESTAEIINTGRNTGYPTGLYAYTIDVSDNNIGTITISGKVISNYGAIGSLTTPYTATTVDILEGATIQGFVGATTVNMSGGTVDGVVNGKFVNISGGEIKSGVRCLDDGTIHITGGVVSSSTNGGFALSNNYAATVYISGGELKTTGAASSRTISNTAGGVVNISGGTVSASDPSGVAVYNGSGNGKITISDNATITSANTRADYGTIVLNNGTVEILGGTVANAGTNASGRAVYADGSATVELGGSPNITGIISVLPDMLGVVNDDEDASKFNPAPNSVYTLDLPPYNENEGSVAVMNGAEFKANFTLNADMNLAERGSDLVMTCGPYALADDGGTYKLTNSKTGNFYRAQAAIDTIKQRAGKSECTIQFGDGGDNTLNIRIVNINFDGSDGDAWGKINLTGKITSTNSNAAQGTISLTNGVSVNSTADIANTSTSANARAIYSNTAGTLTISGGTVSATSGMAIDNSSTGWIHITDGTVSATSGTAVNNNTGTLNISGGEISVTSGTAIRNQTDRNVSVSGGKVSAENGVAVNNAGKITVSDNATITSANVAAASGTIQNTGTVEIIGGTVENTGMSANSRAIYTNNASSAVNIRGGTVSANTGRAIHNNSSGTVDISGGTVYVAGGAYALWNNSTGPVNISGGELYTTIASGGRTINNNGAAVVNISGGTVKAGANIAVYNTSENGKITVSDKATIISANATNNQGTIYNSGGIVEITNGTVENNATNGYAVYCNATRNANSKVELGGNPDIKGMIRADTGTGMLSVNTSFAPNDKIYTIDLAQYANNATAVINGAEFINNFELNTPSFKYMLVETNNGDLAIEEIADGTPEKPYIITTAKQLAQMAQLVNADAATLWRNKYYSLGNDIDLSEYGEGWNDTRGWVPIGNATARSFTGTFTGNGYTISGLYINDPMLSRAGLFGIVNGGTVKNLGVVGDTVTGKDSVGGIVGYLQNSSVDGVSHCYSAVGVGGGSNVGGVVGYMTTSRVYNCYSTGAVSGSNYVGGLIGRGGSNPNVHNSAALNPSVTGTAAGANVGRVLGNTSTPSSLDNNAAFIGMAVTINGTPKATSSNAASIDGADISKLEIYFDGTIGERFTDTDIWTIEAGKLPGLSGKAVDMPEHLRLDLSDAEITLQEENVYSGEEIKPTVTVEIHSITFTEDIHYTVSYNNNTDVGMGTAIVKITGLAPFLNGEAEKRFTINPKTIDISAIQVVPAPVFGAEPVSVIIKNAQFTGTVEWSPSPVNNKFAAETEYTAVITLTATSDNYTFEGVGENFFKVNGVTAANAANSGIVTAVFRTADKVIAAIPAISGHPQGATVSVGTACILTVSASVTDGGALSYQWYMNTSNSNTGGTAISGAGGNSYSPPVDVVGTVYYYVIVTNTIDDNGDGGNKTSSVTSNVAAVTVNNLVNAAVPHITKQPVGATVVVGAACTLTVSAEKSDNGTLSYRWYRNTSTSNTGGTAIAGAAAGASYVVPTSAAGVFYYYVIVTNTIEDNKDGGQKTATVTSNAVTVTVKARIDAAKPTISGHPQGATVSVGTTYDLTVVASVTDGGDLSYRWYRNTSNNTTNGVEIDGAGNNSYLAPVNVVGTVYYYVIVTNTIDDNGDGGNKTASDTSNVATLTVNNSVNAAVPHITKQPVGDTVLAGAACTLSVAAETSDSGTLSYQWYRNTSNSNAGGTAISGAEDSIYAAKSDMRGTYHYYVVVTNTIKDNGDGGQKTASWPSNAAEVVVKLPTVAAEPVIDTQPLGAKIAIDSNHTLTVSASVTGGGTLSYQWYRNTYYSNEGGEAIPNAENQSYKATVEPKKTSYYYVMVTNTIEDNGDGGLKKASVASEVVRVMDTVPRVLDGVKFISPKSDRDLKGGEPDGAPSDRPVYNVKLMALDQYGYDYVEAAASAAVSVRLGGVMLSKSVKTDTKSGTASFGASQAGVEPGTTLTFIASITSKGTTYRDTARLVITQPVSVSEPERVIPAVRPGEEAAVIAPAAILQGEFTAGPNPISKQYGSVNFYRQGRRINKSELRIYDATGNQIKKVEISDKALNTQAKRIAGSWDLTDAKGRPVSAGTYLLRGVIIMSDGKREKISLIIGVR